MTIEQVKNKIEYSSFKTDTWEDEEVMVVDKNLVFELLDKLANNTGIIGNVSEILGYFDYLGDRWHITDIDGEMLNGWRLTPKGKKHTLWIHSDNVMNLVESSR